jgi:cytochrome b pre-mRNA-processing protein 3
MDGSLREMGVGDLAVPAKMRKIGEAFFGRQEAYLQAFSAADPEALVAALTRNVFEEEPPPYVVAHSASKDARDRADAGEAREGASRLATYTREAARRLAEQGEEALGRITFPDPEAVVAADEAPTRDAAP